MSEEIKRNNRQFPT